MIRQLGNLFVLDTANTTYAFRIMPSGHPEHLYYGRKIRIRAEEEAAALTEKRVCLPGNAVCYSPAYPALGLEDVCLEMSAHGKGDIREPFIEVTHADGSYTSDFLFEKAEIKAGKTPFKTLPGSYEENGAVEELVLTLADRQYDLTLELHYFVFEDYDVISRSAKLINTSADEISLERLMSLQLDFSRADWVFTTFHGAWAREVRKYDMPVGICKMVNESYCGTSSNRANPFVMLSKRDTTEDRGDCYGFNLIYSGNHYEAVEQSAFGKMRLVTGINPRSFQFRLASKKVDPARSYDERKVGAYEVTANSGLRLRAGAATNKAVLTTLKKGTIVQCYGYHTASWLYVEAPGGKVGFCHSNYLKKV